MGRPITTLRKWQEVASCFDTIVIGPIFARTLFTVRAQGTFDLSSAEDMSPIPVAPPPSEASEAPPQEHPIELEEVADNEPATPPTPPIKSNMVAHQVCLTISGSQPGMSPSGPAYFSEETTSVLVFDNGGVLLISSAVVPGQLLLLTNVESKAAVVAQIKRKRADRPTLCYVELEFAEPFPRFWGMEFSAASALLPKAARDAEAAALLVASEATADEPGRQVVAPTSDQVSAFKRELEALRNAALSSLPPISSENPFGDAHAPALSEQSVPAAPPALPAQDQPPQLPKFSLNPPEPAAAEQIQAQLDRADEQRAAAQEQLAPAHEQLVPAHEQAAEIHPASTDSSPATGFPAPQAPTDSIAHIPVAAPKEHVNWHEAPLPEPNAQVNWHEVSKAANTPAPPGTDGMGPAKLRSSQDAMLDLLHSHAQESQAQQQPEVTVSLPNLKRMRRPRGNFTPGFFGAVLRIVSAVAAILFVVVGAAWFKHWLPWNSASTVIPRGSLANVSARPKAPQSDGSSASANNSTENAGTRVASDAPVTSPGIVEKPVALPVSQNSDPIESVSANPGSEFPESSIAATRPPSKKPSSASPVKSSVAPVKQPAPRIVEATDPSVVPPKLIRSVRAVASLEALHDFETGNVVIDAVVGTSGEVNFVSVLSGPPSLRAPAVESLKEYLYQPATRNGQPVPAHVTITIHFRFEP